MYLLNGSWVQYDLTQCPHYFSHTSSHVGLSVIFNLHLCLLVHRSIAEFCRRIKMLMMCSCFTRHDFKVYMMSLHRCLSTVYLIAMCFCILGGCHPASRKELQVPCQGMPHSTCGGGRLLFTYDMLIPHIDVGSKLVPPDSKFAFVAHVNSCTVGTHYSDME